MSSKMRKNNNNKEIIISNKPTEIDNEIFRFFEYYQNLNPNQQTKTNTITSSFFKKKAMRKANNQTPHLITSITPNNQTPGAYSDENHLIPESEINKRIAFTNFQKGLDDNYFNDMENKRKAKLGLLLMMNKYSGGEYCKEIKNYFDNMKKSHEEKNVKEICEMDEIKRTFERQKCIESFDNKDVTKFNTDRGFSDKLSKINSEMEFMQSKNKQNFNNLKLLNKIKLPKIVEENNDYYIKKKFTEDLNEDQLANFYYTSEQVERINNNVISGRKTKFMKKEEIKNLLINNRFESGIGAPLMIHNVNSNNNNSNNVFLNNTNATGNNNASSNLNSIMKSPQLFKMNSINLSNKMSFKNFNSKSSKKKVSDNNNKDQISKFKNQQNNEDD